MKLEPAWMKREAGIKMTELNSMTEAKLAIAEKLLERIDAQVDDIGRIDLSNDPTWRADYYKFTGEHMILTEEGWDSGENRESYVQQAAADDAPLSDYILMEINAPALERIAELDSYIANYTHATKIERADQDQRIATLEATNAGLLARVGELERALGKADHADNCASRRDHSIHCEACRKGRCKRIHSWPACNCFKAVASATMQDVGTKP